jgi:hypothetical protein
MAEEPPLREMATGHQVACHFAEEVDGTAEQVQVTGRRAGGAVKTPAAKAPTAGEAGTGVPPAGPNEAVRPRQESDESP